MEPIGLSAIAAPIDMTIIWMLLRWAYMLVAFLFVIFGIIGVTQIKQMNAAFKRRFNMVISLMGLGYLALTVIVLWMTWGVLR